MNVLLLFATGGSKRDIYLKSNFSFLLEKLYIISNHVSQFSPVKFQKFIYSLISPYESLSYTNDWKEAFISLNGFSVESLNLLDQKEAQYFLKKKINNFDLIILLHSVLGDNIDLVRTLTSQLQNRKGKVLSFVGNEYINMKEKKLFLSDIESDYVASQLPKKAFKFIYGDLETKLIAAPHALNHKIYVPSNIEKIYDVSFIGARYPIFIGDENRNNFIDYFDTKMNRLNNVISIGKNKNIPRDLWKKLLQKSKGTIGAEAGTYFLDRDGELLEKAQKLCHEDPKLNMSEIFSKLFDNTDTQFVNGKAISSRHFEPIGTKTCQILLEGNYNGILKANEHYISVKKDYSNFDEALDIYSDPIKRNQITESAFEYVISNHTYEIRTENILNQIFN